MGYYHIVRFGTDAGKVASPLLQLYFISRDYMLILPQKGGLEKILRLLQSVAQIIAFQSVNPHDVIFWMHIRKQFALGTSPLISLYFLPPASGLGIGANFRTGRRYFRFFRFLDCFSKAQELFNNATGWEDLVFGVGKWSMLGAYMGLESLTVVSFRG